MNRSAYTIRGAAWGRRKNSSPAPSVAVIITLSGRAASRRRRSSRLFTHRGRPFQVSASRPPRFRASTRRPTDVGCVCEYNPELRNGSSTGPRVSGDEDHAPRPGPRGAAGAFTNFSRDFRAGMLGPPNARPRSSRGSGTPCSCAPPRTALAFARGSSARWDLRRSRRGAVTRDRTSRTSPARTPHAAEMAWPVVGAGATLASAVLAKARSSGRGLRLGRVVAAWAAPAVVGMLAPAATASTSISRDWSSSSRRRADVADDGIVRYRSGIARSALRADGAKPKRGRAGLRAAVMRPSSRSRWRSGCVCFRRLRCCRSRIGRPSTPALRRRTCCLYRWNRPSSPLAQRPRCSTRRSAPRAYRREAVSSAEYTRRTRVDHNIRMPGTQHVDRVDDAPVMEGFFETMKIPIVAAAHLWGRYCGPSPPPPSSSTKHRRPLIGRDRASAGRSERASARRAVRSRVARRADTRYDSPEAAHHHLHPLRLRGTVLSRRVAAICRGRGAAARRDPHGGPDLRVPTLRRRRRR